MSDCPYCDGKCIAIDDRNGSCYVKACVALGLECQAKMAAEIARLRSLAGAVMPGPSLADIKAKQCQCAAADAPAPSAGAR